MPSGGFRGGYVEDDGGTLLIVRRAVGAGSHFLRLYPNRPPFTRVIEEIETGFDRRLTDGRLLLGGILPPYSRGGYGTVVYEIVRERVDGSVQLAWRWKGDGDGRWRESRPEFSPDGQLWGDVSTLGTGPETSGRVFSFGFAPSNETQLGIPVEFPELDRYFIDLDKPQFLILDSDGPLVLASYHNGAYVVRFDAAAVREFRYLANEVESTGWRDNASTQLYLHWQPQERVLWGRGSASPTWYAYDLNDVDLTVAEPVRAFLALTLRGRPQPQRGFVALVQGEGRHRLLHLWFDPRDGRRDIAIADVRSGGAAAVAHASEWLTGSAPTAGLHPWDRYSLVSPNGQHAIVIEADPSEAKRLYARRLVMTPMNDSDPPHERRP